MLADACHYGGMLPACDLLDGLVEGQGMGGGCASVLDCGDEDIIVHAVTADLPAGDGLSCAFVMQPTQ
jgi:hypothetical protein